MCCEDTEDERDGKLLAALHTPTTVSTDPSSIIPRHGVRDRSLNTRLLGGYRMRRIDIDTTLYSVVTYNLYKPKSPISPFKCLVQLNCYPPALCTTIRLTLTHSHPISICSLYHFTSAHQALVARDPQLFFVHF